MNDKAAFSRILDYIVVHHAIADDLLDIDLNATASDRADSMSADREQTRQREEARAKQMAGPFIEAMRRMSEASRNAQTELCLSDQIPVENAMADALIAYLVSYGLATSHTDAIPTGGYYYCIAVDWDKVDQIASAVGVDPAQLH